MSFALAVSHRRRPVRNHPGVLFNIGLRICMRTDPNVEADLGCAIRGYLIRTEVIEALAFNR